METIEILLPNLDESKRVEVLMMLALQGLDVNATNVKKAMIALK
jgi:hypothetical protein